MNYIRERQGGAHRASPIDKPPPSDDSDSVRSSPLCHGNGEIQGWSRKVSSTNIDLSFSNLYFFIFREFQTI